MSALYERAALVGEDRQREDWARCNTPCVYDVSVDRSMSLPADPLGSFCTKRTRARPGDCARARLPAVPNSRSRLQLRARVSAYLLSLSAGQAD
jgi:hypothetical protein